MTVKELLDSVPYQEIEPHFVRFLRDDAPTTLHHCREAYDFIMAETPEKGLNSQVYVEPNESSELYRIGLRFLDGDWWCHALARELVFAPGYTPDSAELAATCIWEMTYHSFSQDECTEVGDQFELHKEVPSFLDDRLSNLYKRMDRHGYHSGDRMNRSKRKRQYRQENATEILICLRNRLKLCCRMRCAFLDDDLRFLFRVSPLHSLFFRSTVTKGAERIRYIESMMKHYLKVDWSQFTEVWVWLIEPEHDPVNRTQWEWFTNQLSAWIGVPVKFGIYTKSKTKEEIGVGISWYCS